MSYTAKRDSFFKRQMLNILWKTKSGLVIDPIPQIFTNREILTVLAFEPYEFETVETAQGFAFQGVKPRPKRWDVEITMVNDETFGKIRTMANFMISNLDPHVTLIDNFDYDILTNQVETNTDSMLPAVIDAGRFQWRDLARGFGLVLNKTITLSFLESTSLPIPTSQSVIS